jgi:hypothetical protein
MEVRLVWAGHEHQELGWRHAREHFAAAERLAKRAKKLVDNCFCPKPEDKPCPMIAVAPVEPEPTYSTSHAENADEVGECAS